MIVTLHFTCPSCGHKLAAIEAGTATSVVRRTCRRCGECWQLVVAHQPSPIGELHVATFTFLHRRSVAATRYAHED